MAIYLIMLYNDLRFGFAFFEDWRAYIILYGYMLDSWFITRKGGF